MFCMRRNNNNTPFAMYQVLDKDTIRIEILQHLAVAKRYRVTLPPPSCRIFLNDLKLAHVAGKQRSPQRVSVRHPRDLVH